MRLIGRRPRLLSVVGATVLLSLSGGEVALASSGATRQLHPAVVLHGAQSPYKLAGSAARGVVGRRDFGQARSISPLSSPLSEPCSASCSGPVLYWGGPVMRREKLYLIEWEPSEPANNGQVGTAFEALPAEYMKEVGTFLKDVAAESGKLSNVYSVDTLYGEPGASRPGEYNSSFGGEFLDTKAFPARSATECPESKEAKDQLPPKGQPCIADSEADPQLADEVANFVEAHSLPTGLETIYFVLTPREVNSCTGSEHGVAACNTNSYCAYHTVLTSKGKNVIYANMSYDDVEGCETPDRPQGSAADVEIDVLSHENNEAVTDPLGNGWFDYRGDEVADKCTYPFFDPLSDFNPEEDDYGPLLGGTSAEYEPVVIEGTEYLHIKTPGDAYNQEINGDHFLLQREWNNQAGGCVQHAPRVSASFTIAQQSETEFELNAGTSATEAGSITEYTWEFSGGGGAQTGKEVRHRFPAPGEYTVTLNVTNDSGATASAVQRVTVNPALTKTSATITQTATSSVTRRYSADEVAKMLGLPSNGATRPGAGAIVFGHAACPVACGFQVRLFALVREGKRTKWVQIGSLSAKVANKGTRSIALRLNAKGQGMLSARHTLAVALDLTVEDAAGATWKIERHLVLTSAGKAARRRN